MKTIALSISPTSIEVPSVAADVGAASAADLSVLAAKVAADLADLAALTASVAALESKAAATGAPAPVLAPAPPAPVSSTPPPGPPAFAPAPAGTFPWSTSVVAVPGLTDNASFLATMLNFAETANRNFNFGQAGATVVDASGKPIDHEFNVDAGYWVQDDNGEHDAKCCYVLPNQTQELATASRDAYRADRPANHTPSQTC